MRDLMDIIQEAAETGQKIDSTAFLYLPPSGEAEEFAQCKTCILFRPKAERCGAFGPEDVVTAEQSCGFYLHGESDDQQACRSIVTPEQAGLVDGPVRCENCSWFDGECGLYAKLMQALPDVFDLDAKVAAQGCCNAWQKK